MVPDAVRGADVESCGDGIAARDGVVGCERETVVTNTVATDILGSVVNAESHGDGFTVNLSVP